MLGYVRRLARNASSAVGSAGFGRNRKKRRRDAVPTATTNVGCTHDGLDRPAPSCGVIDNVESTPSHECSGVISSAESTPSPGVGCELSRGAVGAVETNAGGTGAGTPAVKPPATYQHIFKGTKKASSLRCQAASRDAAIALGVYPARNERKTVRQQWRRSRVKRRKQEQNLRQVEESEALPSQRMSEEVLDRKHIFFDGGRASNPPITPRLPRKAKKRKKEVTVGRVRTNDVHVVQNTANGAIFRPDPSGDAIFILPPRASNLEISGDDPSELIESLHDLERSTSASVSRGVGKIIMHQTAGTKYCCAGMRPNRDGPGIDMSVNVAEMEAKSWDSIVDYVIRCETSFTRWVDSNVLRTIRRARKLVGFPTLAKQDEGGGSAASIFGSVAFGRNVYLNSHRDEDFTYSIVSVHRRLPHGRNSYAVDDDIICYFVFPRYGMAVPLRPGDVLIFNPQEYHCISSRVSDADDVYCLSIYLKSAVVGLSDNRTPLSEDQQRYADAYNAARKAKIH